ncbi:MAG: energy-coupling factor transporter ATPase [Clostridia bacterium]|nr:energy-coupling factor transporter ATPase [Clostridia bacterium]
MHIEVKNLTHVYSEGMPFETIALENVNFIIESGEFVCLIGHTGSGKSTLIQHINGLLRPNEGCVLIDGNDIKGKAASIRDIRKKIGLVFQYPEYQLFEESVLKDVCFGPINLGFSLDEAQTAARKALKLVGIDPEVMGDRSPFSLSGGEKRRVAIAGVLAMEPEVLILDEPTAGLDPKGHKDILKMIEDIRAERHLTILLISHNMDDVARLATHVIVMAEGSVVMDGTPSQIFSRGEELNALGLSLPSSTALMQRLQAKGFAMNANILTIDDAEEEIVRVFG